MFGENGCERGERGEWEREREREGEKGEREHWEQKSITGKSEIFFASHPKLWPPTFDDFISFLPPKEFFSWKKKLFCSHLRPISTTWNLIQAPDELVSEMGKESFHNVLNLVVGKRVMGADNSKMAQIGSFAYLSNFDHCHLDPMN